MKIYPALRILLAIGFSALILTADLNALSSLTWVSGIGDDTNPGSRIFPGKTFAAMISKTSAGGQISAVDPGNFGLVTIGQAITIDGTSLPTDIAVTSSGTSGITVTAGASDVVILRHITINGNNVGATGITFNSGKQLIIEDCNIDNCTTAIAINLASAGNVVIRNTSISGVTTGVSINGTSGAVNVSLCNVSIQETTSAAVDAQYGNVQIANSMFSQNSGVGVIAGNTSIVSCINSLFASNNIAVQATTGSTLRISNNDFYNNTTAIDNAGGVVATANNNRDAGSTTPGSPTTSIVYQ